jgi:glutamate--cysteine ligase
LSYYPKTAILPLCSIYRHGGHDGWSVGSSDKIYLCAELLGQDYQAAVKTIGRRIEQAELTPSAITLSEMKDHNQGFFDYTNAWAKQHRQAFLAACLWS